MHAPDGDAERRGRTPNRLIHQTSPYLLQHAYNPVDWHPWGPEALERARREDKPILLSVGYAACHWCHVMERESFEDPATAALMNASFVPVKVDREERPDLDGVYMGAVQAMTGQGGWPMTVFCTPDGAPFFAGTYFPATERLGMPSFRRVLEAIAAAWREQREEVVRQGGRVLDQLRLVARAAASPEPLQEGLLRSALAALRRELDPDWGGFGQAPKFPQPMALEFALRRAARGDDGALALVTLTLDRMAAGGIHDQLGGGFHRYSTDRRWLVPHFEKMLYDNAQLARVYTHAWQVTRDERYRQVVAGTVAYLLRELRHPDGGFFSSADADSEGVEGRFFVWSHEELVRLAGEPVAAWFGAVPEGNWEGANVLWTPRDAAAVAAEAGLSAAELARQVEAGRAALFEARERRPRPATDDKVLAAWNGLAVAALAEAGRVFGERAWVAAATDAAAFVLGTMRAPSGRLARAWRDGRRGGPGYLDDHALMAEACLTLYETTFELRWLEEAHRLAADLRRLFADPDQGGFFQTGTDAEALVVRPRELLDNAVPAGNSVAAEVLLRLALLTGDAGLEATGASALRLVAQAMERAPTLTGYALGALDLYLGGAREIAIVGDPAAAGTRALVEVVWERYLPAKVLAAAPAGDGPAAELAPLLRGRPAVDGRATAYVCERFACRRPVTTPADLAGQLAG
ncbi:MAG TPA: thioredoxin domain-containing protein [Actinomycetes bacterium]|nr:thioredoxin domain-containing protein [Actinomycetes bacterium]